MADGQWLPSWNDSDAFRQAIDDALRAYLGSSEHRSMMKTFGFADAEIDLVAG